MTTSNVHRLEVDGKEVILVGTAHVSRESVTEVKNLIDAEQPDTVCIELCEARFDTIMNKEKWQQMDIIRVIKDGKALLLLVNLLMSSFQKRMANQFGIEPGQEMLQAIESAKENEAEISLVDRNIQVTLNRFWQKLGFMRKMKLVLELILSVLDTEEIDEEELEMLKSEDMLTTALNDLKSSFPELKEVLIDERDKYLAQKIKESPGEKLVAVLGAGHIPGVKEEIYKENDLAELTRLKPKSKKKKALGWMIPLIIVLIIASTFTFNKATGINQIISWILWNGSLSAIGTLIAFGHPLSILTAFVAAPISSLSPLLAAGWFAGLTEAFVKKPNVKDFEDLPEDINSLKGFWKNKVSHLLLVVVFANIGSTLGTLIGGADVIRMFIDTVF